MEEEYSENDQQSSNNITTDSSKIGAILGGILGGFAFLFLLVFLFRKYYLKN